MDICVTKFSANYLKVNGQEVAVLSSCLVTAPHQIHKMAALIGLSAIGGIVKVATNTKKAIDFLQSFKGVEEEGYILWKTLEALNEPVTIAGKLLVRHEAL